MFNISRTAMMLVMLTVVLSACKKKAAEVEPTTPPPAGQQGRGGGQQAPPSAPADDGAAAAARAAMIAANVATINETIYFDYDISELSMAARANLDMKIAILRANPAVRIRVAGHCDSRGSDEYNIALAQRRAAAAKEYMTARGIDANRIETISYGEERPAVQGDTEAAYSRNRRDEFTIVAGSITTPVGN